LAKKKEVSKEVVQDDIKHTKEALLTSNKYKHKRDLLNTILENEKSYTFSEVEEKLNTFLQGEVK